MASPVFLDTTVLIDVLRNRPAAARLRDLEATDDPPHTCAINVEEVIRGLRSAERSKAGRLLDGLRILPIGRAEGERAGVWRRDFGARGITLSQADCLIAAAALSVGARLATGNPKDFPMRELRVEHWPVGR